MQFFNFHQNDSFHWQEGNNYMDSKICLLIRFLFRNFFHKSKGIVQNDFFFSFFIIITHFIDRKVTIPWTVRSVFLWGSYLWTSPINIRSMSEIKFFDMYHNNSFYWQEGDNYMDSKICLIMRFLLMNFSHKSKGIVQIAILQFLS